MGGLPGPFSPEFAPLFAHRERFIPLFIPKPALLGRCSWAAVQSRNKHRGGIDRIGLASSRRVWKREKEKKKKRRMGRRGNSPLKKRVEFFRLLLRSPVSFVRGE